MKRTLILGAVAVCVLAVCAAFMPEPELTRVEAGQVTYELPCGGGTVPVVAAGFQSFNPQTNQFRALACINPSNGQVQILPANLGTGTPGAGKYVDGASGAWTVIPASGVSESVIGLGNGAQTSTLVCAAGNAAAGCQFFFWANAHTVTRLIINVSTAPSGCSTNAVYGLKDLTASSVVTSLTPTSTGVTDSGSISVATTAAHQFVLGLTTAAVGCSTFITANSMSITFQ